MKKADPAGALVESIRQRAGPEARIAFVSGNFNILHPGHFRLLRFAAESADFLVVGVNPDSTPGATLPAADRLQGVSSLSMVDEAFMLDESPAAFVERLRPNFVVKGKEFEARHNPEEKVLESYGGRLLFSSGEMRFSSQALLKRETEADFSSIHPSLDYPQRHGFHAPDLLKVLPSFKGLRVLVIGDLIIDTYVNCDPLGMSQEDPTLVVTPLDEQTFVGGAGIVAAHARGLGADVHFLSVVGRDAEADLARESLKAFGVTAELLPDETRPTTTKRRYRARGKTLLRVNRLRQHGLEHELSRELIGRATEKLAEVDMVLFSDFNYGVLPQSVVDPLVGLAKSRDLVMAADSQASSQLADISRFEGMDLITPTEREARLALQDFESGLVIIAEDLQKKAKAKNVLITLGEEGVLAYSMKDGEYRTDRLPAFNTSPKDVAGAGDSLFTCTSLALRAGVDFWQSTYLGALAAACQVSRVGNTPLTGAELAAEITQASF